MSTTREALEAALAANPDDVAAHSAYADLLIEAGDPRGEYIRLQLALEDRNQPTDRLRAMEQEAFALRREHEAEWLGPLAEFVLPKRGPSVGAMVADNVEVTWRRGWVHRLTIPVLTSKIATATWGAFQITCLLAEVEVRSVLEPLTGDFGRILRWHEKTLRSIDFGSGNDSGAVALLEAGKLPRLERLRLNGVETRYLDLLFGGSFPRLLELEVSTQDGMTLPLQLLTANSTLSTLRLLHLDMVVRHDPEAAVGRGRLTAFFRSPHLRSLQYLGLRLPGFGDAGVDELISSGMVARLKGLDLCRCEITDDGAQELAACPDVARLEYLHLDNNLLSPVGIEALAAVGVTVSDRQMYGGWEEV